MKTKIKKVAMGVILSSLVATFAIGAEIANLKRFTVAIENNETFFIDRKTGLTWQALPLINFEKDSVNRMSWEQALKHCEDLEYGGTKDWRLPNINELNSLIDDTRFDPAVPDDIDEYFPKIDSEDEQRVTFWSSSPYINSGNDAWNTSFSLGEVGINSKYGTYSVRCVRGGQ